MSNSINPIDEQLFEDDFGKWLESHGVELSPMLVGKKFVAHIDLNELKPAILSLLANKTAQEWAICTDFFKNGGKIILRGFIDKDSALIARGLIESNDPQHRTFAVDEINRNRVQALQHKKGKV